MDNYCSLAEVLKKNLSSWAKVDSTNKTCAQGPSLDIRAKEKLGLYLMSHELRLCEPEAKFVANRLARSIDTTRPYPKTLEAFDSLQKLDHNI